MSVGREEPFVGKPRSWWSKLGSRGQRFFVGASVFVFMWCVVAIPPFFTYDHRILLCAREFGCYWATPGEFVVGEVALAIPLLGFAAVFFVLAHSRGQTEGLDPRDY